MTVISAKVWKRPFCSDFVGSVVRLVLKGKEGRRSLKDVVMSRRVSGGRGREFGLRVMRKRRRRIRGGKKK